MIWSWIDHSHKVVGLGPLRTQSGQAHPRAVDLRLEGHLLEPVSLIFMHKDLHTKDSQWFDDPGVDSARRLLGYLAYAQ